MAGTSTAQPDNTRASLLLRLNPESPARELAWTEFCRLYVPIIRGFARNLGVPQGEIDDVTQEVLRRFFQASSNFVYDPSKGRFRGYLKTCTVRVLAAVLPRTTVRGVPVESVDPADPAVEKAWELAWESERLARAVDTVRAQYASDPRRAVTFRSFEMYVIFQHPAEAVASELGISVESVYAAKQRVGKALKRELAKEDDIG